MHESGETKYESEFNPPQTKSCMSTETAPESTEYSEEVIDGTVMRITGAGNFIVYPTRSSGNPPRDVRVGNPVRIIASAKTVTTGRWPMLEARQELITAPMASTWAIVASGRQPIERCRVFYNGVQLNTVDHMGELRSEARLPRDGSLSFHIPNSMEINDAFSVQVRDGDRLLRSETFGSIRAMPTVQQRV
jgi:hypothetical protein